MIEDVNSWLMALRRHELSVLPELLNESRPEQLSLLVDQWTAEKSAWAVAEQVRYLQSGIVPRGHRVVVRRLIRSAAEKQHDRVMSAAMVFADLLRDTPAFSPATTAYLQRFAWRYMRNVAKSRPADYCRVLSAALRAYPSTSLHSSSVGEPHLLRRWCLLKACYGKHAALRFTSSGVSLKPQTELKALSHGRHCMAYRELWETKAGQAELRRLVKEARSKAMAEWANQQLQSASGEHAAMHDLR